MFHKYSLGDDTTTPIGLYTSLRHVFLVFVLSVVYNGFCRVVCPCVSFGPNTRIFRVLEFRTDLDRNKSTSHWNSVPISGLERGTWTVV